PPDIHKIRRQVTQSFSKAPRFSAMNLFFDRCAPPANAGGPAGGHRKGGRKRGVSHRRTERAFSFAPSFPIRASKRTFDSTRSITRAIKTIFSIVCANAGARHILKNPKPARGRVFAG
ncbi:hypothetical protein, partial [Burkholderia pseudomallei]|uniref:hypothetical protein n=2 Tax=Burkholderia pseudomallei TaxID=28450 RepID=UPI001C4B5065